MPAPAPSPAPAERPWSRRTEIAVIVGFWGLVGTLALLRRAAAPFGPGVSVPEGLLTFGEYGLWAALTPLIFALARRLPLERTAVLRRIALLLGLALAGAALVQLVELFVLRPLLAPDLPFGRGPRPPGAPGGPFRPTPADVLVRLWFVDEFVVFVAVLAAGYARDYFLRYRERAARTALLEAQLAEARLAALRMQLNPHFLFNTLHAVSALVERDPGGARLVVARLSALLRHALDGTPAQEVPLRDELDALRLFLDIQRVRFGDGLVVEEDVEPAALDALVPALLLQPLVENAVEHGVSRVEGAPGRLAITARVEPGPPRHLVVRVRDNGPGPEPEAVRQATGVGLANTRSRLAALYGDAATLRLTATEDGAEAVVALPCRTASDLPAADG